MHAGVRFVACWLSLSFAAASTVGQAADSAGPPLTATSSTAGTAQRAMVVTIHHDATDAGVEVLREGDLVPIEIELTGWKKPEKKPANAPQDK